VKRDDDDLVHKPRLTPQQADNSQQQLPELAQMLRNRVSRTIAVLGCCSWFWLSRLARVLAWPQVSFLTAVRVYWHVAVVLTCPLASFCHRQSCMTSCSVSGHSKTPTSDSGQLSYRNTNDSCHVVTLTTSQCLSQQAEPCVRLTH
jgi:hypothetical protein